MTDTMIERVAKRICDGKWDAKDFTETASGETPEEQREYWMGIARAAIEAMIDPTPTMLDDMRHEIGTTMHITLPDYALIAAWKMAVLSSLSDAALQETKG